MRQLRHQGSDWLLPAVVIGLLRVADAAVVLLAASAAWITRFHDDPTKDLGIEAYATVLAMVLTIHILQAAGLYSFSQLTNLFGQVGRLLLAWAAVMLSLLALGFMIKMNREIAETSRLWVGLWFVYGFFGLFTVRLVLKHQIQRWQSVGRLTRNLVVVGAGEHGQRLIEHLSRHGTSGERIIGVFDDRQGRVPEYVCGFPVLGSIVDLMAFARSNPIDQVIVALPWDAENRLLAWMKKLRSLPVDVRLCPDMIGFHLPHRQVTHVGGVPMLNVFEKPLAGWNYIVKSMEDRMLAAAILVLILPLLAVLCALIKLDSRGPILFRQKRYGFNNEVIEVFKFRSMYIDRCEDEAATAGDPARPAGDPDRPHPAPDLARRAAAVHQRPQGHDVDRRPQAARDRPQRAVLAADRRVSGPPPGQARHHRLGPGQRSARRDRDPREDGAAGALRPLLHRELVAAVRHPDHSAHPVRRLQPPERLLIAWSGARPAAAAPTSPPAFPGSAATGCRPGLRARPPSLRSVAVGANAKGGGVT